ncbi:MAG: hypothetical protein MMC23_007730 [Stictis urceolatum]|nr:hypothetical protein [Stictis urceolata]
MHLLHWAFSVLLSITTLLTSYVYLFPLWHACTFPTKQPPYSPSLSSRVHDAIAGRSEEQRPSAEFRLLAFGDPQLEGDTSIWRADEDALYRPHNLIRELQDSQTLARRLSVLNNATKDLVFQAVPSQLAAWRKQLDLLGNDYYLAHIYRSVSRATNPTHVTVLGDLLGSQWIDDDEFETRAWRYWNRVFRRATLVDKSITGERKEETLGHDTSWTRRIISIAGNHDIGYAGDISEQRVSRFEEAFGSVNWEIIFHHPQKREPTGLHPTLRIVVLNSMNLDAPAKSTSLQGETYEFINKVITDSKPVEDRTVGTVLLTHIPLHKEAGVCVDAPFFDFHGEDDGGGIKEQNHLTYDAGKGAILEGLYGMSGHPDAPGGGFGRPGLILNGHDHEGCDTYHYLPTLETDQEDSTRGWNAARFKNSEAVRAQPIPGIREVTLRAMMGEFGGFAYLISGWFDFDAGEWRFEVHRCSAGVQHWWWAAHVLMLITAALGSVIVLVEMLLPGGAAAYESSRARNAACPKSIPEREDN